MTKQKSMLLSAFFGSSSWWRTLHASNKISWQWHGRRRDGNVPLVPVPSEPVLYLVLALACSRRVSGLGGSRVSVAFLLLYLVGWFWKCLFPITPTYSHSTSTTARWKRRQSYSSRRCHGCYSDPTPTGETDSLGLRKIKSFHVVDQDKSMYVVL